MIPITKPYFDKREADAVGKALDSGWVSQGPKVMEFESAFSKFVGSKYACAVSNCTTALHLALLAIGVKPGDVVITVSHSFIATANSIRYCGAEPLFVDIDPGTYNMSVDCLERCLEKDCRLRGGKVYYKESRVAAIMAVHQMGMPCDMKGILSAAKRFKVPVVEDAACAAGSEVCVDPARGREKIGKPHSEIACFSFHPRKLITTGEGGMITTNNSAFDRRFRLLRQHGMSISDRKRHAAKKVVFEQYLETGYNYRMSDIHAAIGIEQLRKLPVIIKERRRIADRYKEMLGGIKWLRLPIEPDYCRTNWQSYPVMVTKGAPAGRNKLMQMLLNSGISTRRGIMNSHQEKPYQKGILLKNSEMARDSVILLPIFYGLKEEEMERVARVIKDA